MKTKGISVRSFNARYGYGVLKRYSEIIKKSIKYSLCNRCNFKKLIRTSLGLWTCKKCNFQVAGAAYTLQ